MTLYKQTQQSMFLNFNFRNAYSSPSKSTDTELPRSNASIIKNDWGSSCRPNYDSMVKRIKTFFNNVIFTCDTKHNLTKDQRVKIIRHFDTGLRKYRYVKINYMYQGKIITGWIAAGKKPNYWMYVVPDDINLFGPN